MCGRAPRQRARFLRFFFFQDALRWLSAGKVPHWHRLLPVEAVRVWAEANAGAMRASP